MPRRWWLYAAIAAAGYLLLRQSGTLAGLVLPTPFDSTTGQLLTPDQRRGLYQDPASYTDPAGTVVYYGPI